MRCPSCSKRLYKIIGGCKGEWYCANTDCLENSREHTYAEFYGSDQQEINNFYRQRGKIVHSKAEVKNNV